MRGYLRALSFLTVIPLPFGSFSREGGELSAAAVWFPLAGGTLGLILALAAWLLGIILAPVPVVVMVMAASFLLTRGLHLDGLADTADGLIGTTGRDNALKAMDDSAIGVMGASCLFYVCLLKAVLLLSEGSVHLVPALVFMPLAGRWAIVSAGAWFNPAKDKGLGNLFLSALVPSVFLKASLTAFAVIVPVVILRPGLFAPVVCGCIAALVVSRILAGYSLRRLGGVTGDILGAACELGELGFLLGFYTAVPLLSRTGELVKVVMQIVPGF